VTFPLFAKLDVNGANTHPLFDFLKSKTRWFWKRRISWNFTKFLIDREGNVIERYAPTVSPLSIQGDIEKLI
jgi:glutathione peroxidase